MRVRFDCFTFRFWSGSLTLVVAALCSPLPGSTAHAAAGTSFLPHQALYDLSLLKSRGGTSLDSARGRILYKFSGNACEGYTSDFRQVSEMDGGEGRSTLSDLQSTSWEDAEGKSYRFKIVTRMNDSDQSEVDGLAERTGDKITVKLTQPVAKTFTVDGKVVFPTEQIQRIIAAAKEGKSLLELTVYDGSDNGEKVYNTLSVIGKPIHGDKPGSTPDPSTTNDQMKKLTRWPVTVSYYDRDAKTNSGEQTPVYAMSFELFEDGVSRALVLDYNDFVISGTLGKFDVSDVRKAKPCK
ncbi:cell envelope integrity EipB family protein [Nitrobacter sp.]|uniref:cell envelope integrity EipB family protein n=1 Tax=Nitrobacter sp. TaxID=29420 RepID=UPI003F650FD6